MDIKRKLEIMKHIEQSNKRHLDEWKEGQRMNANAAFVDEQKSRVNEIADLLIVIQGGVLTGNIVPTAISNSIGIAVDALHGIAAAMNSVSSIVKSADM